MSEQTDKMLVRYTQAETAYVPLSLTPGAACANCRWFMNTSDVGQGCHIIENYPADVLPTGWCNHHEALPSLEPEPIPVELVGIGERAHEGGFVSDPDIGGTVSYTWNVRGKVATSPGAATTLTLNDGDMVVVHDEQPQSLYLAPDSNNPGVLKSLLERFARGLKPGQTVFKAADGQRYMLIVTSNSYRDREAETIKTVALQEYVNRAWKADDLFISRNPQLFWHDDRLVMGDIVWADMRGPFLVELAKEADNPIAHKMYDYIESHPEEKWGASHRFGYYKSDRDAEGTYHRIFKQETTTLPREAAANLLTYSGVLPVTHKDDYLNKMLGLPNAAELLDKGIDTLVAELAKNGVAHKSADEPGVEFTAISKAFVQLVQDVADMSEQLDAAKKDYTDKAAALDTERQVMTDAFKTIQGELDTLKAQLDARPRSASRATETQVEGTASEDAQKTLDALQYENHPLFGRIKKQPDQL